MTPNRAQTATLGQSVAPVTCGRFRKDFRLIEVLVPLWERIWPVGTAAEVAFRTGLSPRMAEYLLARDYDISGSALANLWVGDTGLEHLDAIMKASGKPPPAFYADFRRQVRLSQLSKSLARISEDRARLEREFALSE